jgi:hypothetical protein
MKNLKRLGVSVTLLCVLSLTTLAGDTNSPPCAPSDTNSPPCAMAQITPDPESAETVAPASTSGSAYSVSKVGVDLLQSVLLLF